MPATLTRNTMRNKPSETYILIGSGRHEEVNAVRSRIRVPRLRGKSSYIRLKEFSYKDSIFKRFKAFITIVKLVYVPDAPRCANVVLKTVKDWFKVFENCQNYVQQRRIQRKKGHDGQTFEVPPQRAEEGCCCERLADQKGLASIHSGLTVSSNLRKIKLPGQTKLVSK